MSRANMVALGVLVALILGIGYYAMYEPTGELRASCTESFKSLDAASNDNLLDGGEFLAYRGGGVSAHDFARADTDNSQTLTVQEFCSWESTGAQRG
jgi:hypothetical protein